MNMRIDSTSNLCGLNYTNLHLKQIQEFLSKGGISVSFSPAERVATLSSQHGLILNASFRSEVQKILENCADEISNLEISLKKNHERMLLIDDLKQFNPNRVVDLLKKYLKIAKPNYSESSKYVQFDDIRNKWIHDASSPYLGRMIALFRNVIDFFSSRQPKRRIAKTVLNSLSHDHEVSKEGFEKEASPQSNENKSALNHFQVAIEKNKVLDSKGGRLGLLLNYSLFAYNQDKPSSPSPENLIDNIVSKMSL